MKTIILPSKFIDILLDLPETGMGYQTVNVNLRSGRVLDNKNVINCELLIINDDEYITVDDILSIEVINKPRESF